MTLYILISSFCIFMPRIFVPGRGPLTDRLIHYVTDLSYPVSYGTYDSYERRPVDILISFRDETEISEICSLQEKVTPKLAVFVCPMTMGRYDYIASQYKISIFEKFNCRCFIMNVKGISKSPMSFEQSEDETIITLLEESLNIFYGTPKS